MFAVSCHSETSVAASSSVQAASASAFAFAGGVPNAQTVNHWKSAAGTLADWATDVNSNC